MTKAKKKKVICLQKIIKHSHLIIDKVSRALHNIKALWQSFDNFKSTFSLTFSWLTQRVTDLYTKDLQRGLVLHNAKEIIIIKTLLSHFSKRNNNKTMFLDLKRKHGVPSPQDERFFRVMYIFFLFVVCCPVFVPFGPGKYN